MGLKKDYEPSICQRVHRQAFNIRGHKSAIINNINELKQLPLDDNTSAVFARHNAIAALETAMGAIDTALFVLTTLERLTHK